MKLLGNCALLMLLALMPAVTSAELIQDPIADYLSLQVPDRSEFVGTLEVIDRVKVDIDGDGTDEVFVGTWYRYSGSELAYYWSGYKQVQGGYQRISPANQEIPIPSFENAYIGPITEIAKQGVVVAYDVEVDNPEDANVTKVGMLSFYYIENGELKEEHRGELDMSNSADKAIYDRYFGEERQTRQPSSVDTFTTQQLQQMGYTIPNWEPPPP